MSAFNAELVQSAAFTTAGVSQPANVSTGTMAALLVNITALSGTVAFDLWLEGEGKEGAWFEIPADQVLKSSGIAAENTVVANHRSAIDNHTTGTAKYLAKYGHLPYSRVRCAWIISGSTPSVTFDARLVGK